MSSNSNGSAIVGGVFLAALVVCGLGGTIARANYNDHVAECTVVDKDRGASHDGTSHYRIYTKECGVLANDDQWLVGKTASADVWAQIEKGHTYRLRIVGWRFPLFSQFPNIVSVEGEVPTR